MPIIHFINSKTQTAGGMKNVLAYVTRTEKTKSEDKQNVTAPVLIISTQNRLTAICLLQSFYIVFYQFIYPIVDVTEYKSKTLRFFDIDSM